MPQKTPDPVVIRVDFDNPEGWESVCDLIRAPVSEGEYTFYAHVGFVDDPRYRGVSISDLLASLSQGYKHSFLFVVDSITLASPDFPILVVDLVTNRGNSFRAIPFQIQAIENNLSIPNMGFEEFAEAVDEDGIFRGFPKR